MQLSLIIALAIFAGCILIAVLFGQHFGQHNAEQSAPGKQTAPGERATPVQQAKAGKFQVATAVTVSPRGEPVNLIVVCDTATGQCWACDSTMANGDCRSPLATNAPPRRDRWGCLIVAARDVAAAAVAVPVIIAANTVNMLFGPQRAAPHACRLLNPSCQSGAIYATENDRCPGVADCGKTTTIWLAFRALRAGESRGGTPDRATVEVTAILKLTA
jgi:hypothetical protein